VKKIQAGDPESMSKDTVLQNIEQLRNLFPEVWTEGKLDFDILKQLLGGIIDNHEEKYGLNWHGKRSSRRLALTPSLGTLRPCHDESMDWDTTKNLMIEGDNLEVLKLLQKSYAGEIQMIYIDPPYNTGKDFVYPDDYHDNIRNYLEITGQTVEGGKKVSSNTDTSGRFHTEWLNMMYPRLKLSHQLLKKQGVLIAQIGDVELPHLKRMLDEIFGEENYLNLVTVKAKVAAGASGGGEDKRLKKNVEYLLVYAKDFSSIEGFTHCFIEEPLMDVIAEMKDAGQSWKYTSILVNEGTREKLATTKDGDGNQIDIFLHRNVERTSLREVCKKEGLSEEEAYLKYLPVLFSDTNAQTSIRTRVIEAAGPLSDACMYSVEYVPTSGREKGQRVRHYYISPTVRRVIWLKDVAYIKNNRVIKRERTGTLWDDISYNNIGKEGGVQFPNGKKPLELLQRILSLTTDKQGIYLDFFAGSGTTGHAVVSQNANDEGTRKFILVQLPELLDDADSDNEWACQFCDEIGKPRNIAELTKERLRRSLKFIANDNPLFKGDFGFRVFKLDSSNLISWDPRTVDLSQTLLDGVEHVKSGRSESDVLFELLLKLGLNLCDPIQVKSISGKTIHSIGSGTLIACLEPAITQQHVESLAIGIVDWLKGQNPAGQSTIVFRDSAFSDDVTKTNLTAILQQHGIENVRSL
jgi:adenine-specific DNA-methyltransferase